MADPGEGVAADGTIRTGARRGRVPVVFEPVLADAVAFAGESGASLYVYGSVVTGTVRPRSSDVDLLSIDLPTRPCSAGACRPGTPIDAGRWRSPRPRRATWPATATRPTASGSSCATTASTSQVPIRPPRCGHFLPTLGLPAVSTATSAGTFGDGATSWRPARWLGTSWGIRIARKTLLAVAGLVSVHDHTWTTDRSRAAGRWGEIEPGLAAQLRRLHFWTQADHHPAREEVERVLADDGIADAIVERFASLIGLWTDDPEDRQHILTSA